MSCRVASLRAGVRANNVLLRLIEVVDEVVAKVEVGLNNRRRSQSQPLAQRYILEVVYNAQE